MLKLFKPVFIKRLFNTCENILKSPVPDIVIQKNIVLSQYVLDKISKWSDKVAVECIETKRKYTYNELKIKSLALAHFLRNSLKLEEKSCVGVLLPNLPEYPIVLIGSIQAGLQMSPINPNYTNEEIKKQLVNSKAKALFAVPEREKDLKSICDSLNIPLIVINITPNTPLSTGTINFFDHVAAAKGLDEIYTKNVSADDVVLLPFSSGTTGLPKGVQLCHSNLVSNLTQASLIEFNFYKEGEDTVLAFLPFFHIYGLSMILLNGLSQGVKLITFPKFTSRLFVNSLRQYKPTLIPSVPPIIHLINTSPYIQPMEDLASIRSIVCGAAPLTEYDVIRFKEITKDKVDLIQAYGMTETSSLAIIQTKFIKGGIKLGGSGYLIPNTQAKITSIEDFENNNPLGVNENGQLLITGPQVMKGYLDNPEATKETFTDDGWLKTGDIGYYDEDGHLFITDRLKELIKVQGYPVAPAELESIIRDHPSVEDVAVIGVCHEKLGEAPKAFIVQKKNFELKPEDIEEFVAAKVVKYKHLTGGVTFLENIPKTASGKILRRDLKKLI